MKTKFISFVWLVFTLQACSWTHSSEPVTPSFDTRILEEHAVQEISYKQSIVLPGIVRINEDKLYHYRAPEDGVVEQIHFALGDAIQPGTPLLTLKSPAYTALRKELKEVEQELRLQERSLASAQSMYEDGLLAEQAYLATQAELKNTQQKINQIKSTLELYGFPLSDHLFELRAKQGGIVIQKEVTPYLAVAKEETLLRMADLSTVWVQVAVPPSQIASIKEGDSVTLRSVTYPEEQFSGQVHRIAPTIDETTKVLQAFIRVANPTHLLKPALHVEVKVNLDKAYKQLAVPTEALIFDANQQHVILRRGTSYFIHPVVVGHTYQEYTFIQEGLHVNDTLITKNNLLMYNHLKSAK